MRQYEQLNSPVGKNGAVNISWEKKMLDITVTHEYNGTAIPQRITDEYVDVTALCQSEGKLIGDYIRLKSSKEYVSELSSSKGIPIEALLITGTGGGHTYAHKLVAMDVAQWVSVKCKAWANETLVKVVESQNIQSLNASLTPAPKRRPLTETQMRKFTQHYGELKALNPSWANAYAHMMAVNDPRYADVIETGMQLLPAETTPHDEHHVVSYFALKIGVSARQLNLLLTEWGIQTSDRDHKNRIQYHPTEKYEHLAYWNEDKRDPKTNQLRPQLEWKIGLMDVIKELWVGPDRINA